MSIENPDLAHAVETLKFVAMTDGTHTRVEIRLDDEDGPTIAYGSAKRAKGERRNGAYGVALAAHRAAMNLAEKYASEIKRIQHP